MSIPDLDELIERSVVVALPMVVAFRGITTREALLFEGPRGWGEFAPFWDYGPERSAWWLRSGIETAWHGMPEPVRERVEVNATVPAVEPGLVPEVLERYPGCRTIKVKVAEKGQTLAEDRARVQAVRQTRPDAVVRVDANCNWSVDQAFEAAAQLGPLDYMEQPCATIAELKELRLRLMRAGMFVRVAADESIRLSDDPFLVAEENAADVAVVKVAPLGGPRRVLEIAAALRARMMDITVASALDTAVGLDTGLATVAALPTVTDDDYLDVPPAAAGLATGQLFYEDVAEPRYIVDGLMEVTPRVPDPARIDALRADAATTNRWHERLRDTYAALSTRR